MCGELIPENGGIGLRETRFSGGFEKEPFLQ